MAMQPQSCDLTVTRATVMPFDDDWSTLFNCDIVVRDGRIAAMGEAAAVRVDPQAKIDGRHLVITPGFVNAHTHSPEALKRGLADTAPLGDWLETVWSSLDAIEPEQIALAVRLCAAEMLHGGVTEVIDHFRQSPLTEQAIGAAANAWAGSGMRSTMALMLRDRALPAWLRDSMPDWADQMAVCRAATERWQGLDGRMHIAMGPSAPTRCTDRLLQECADYARSGGLRIHMHCDETRGEAASARHLYGSSAIEHLTQLGFLGPDVSLAHAVWVSDEDILRLAASQTAVVHNPVSNLRLGSGRASVEKFLRAGVRVAIGSDGAASNDTQSVLEAAKLAILIPRLETIEPLHWPTARDGLRMATEALAVEPKHSRTRLEVGGRADFAAFDMRSPALVPTNDLHCQFAFAGASMRAVHVVIAGKLVLYDGEILSFDESAMYDEARAFQFNRRATENSR